MRIIRNDNKEKSSLCNEEGQLPSRYWRQASRKQILTSSVPHQRAYRFLPEAWMKLSVAHLSLKVNNGGPGACVDDEVDNARVI